MGMKVCGLHTAREKGLKNVDHEQESNEHICLCWRSFFKKQNKTTMKTLDWISFENLVQEIPYWQYHLSSDNQLIKEKKQISLQFLYYDVFLQGPGISFYFYI